MNRRYYSLAKTGNTANIDIYGDITSWPWEELGEVSAANLSKRLSELGDVDEINVHISSYGGEVKEGLAIYNALKQHKAKVKTFCDGFACSIASVIFMAGDERVMNDSSLLMIHNAWSYVEGNANELRKQADDLDKITQASVIAYKAHSNLSEEEIKALLDAETWILPEEALEYGFATSIEKTESKTASQSARKRLFEIVMKHNDEADDASEADDEEEQPEEPEEPEVTDDEADDQDDQNGENDQIETENDEDETPDESEEDEEPTEEAAQYLSGFFNALIKNI